MSLFKNKNKEQYQIVLSNDKPLFQPKRTTTTQVENQQYFVSGSMPVRRVYKIDISDIKAKDIQGYMRGVMDQYCKWCGKHLSQPIGVVRLND